MFLERTNLTNIVNNNINNNVVYRQEIHRISEILRENKFLIYEDETSDITNDKWLSLMVRYVEPRILHTDCSANKIFQSFENELLKKNISLRLIVGLTISCDNAFSLNIITLPCVCHSSALAAKEACETISKDNMLANFLMEQVSENICAANNLLLIFQNPTTKAYLFFFLNLHLIHSTNIIQNFVDFRFRCWIVKFMKSSLLKSAGFGHIIRIVNFSDQSTVLKVLQVNRRLEKLIDKYEVRNEWKFLYEVDLLIKVEWSKLLFDDIWRQINTKTRKRNSMFIKTLNSICVIKYG
ncbi:hypothetical protein ACFW04_013922 [Cataglyphis niger]